MDIQNTWNNIENEEDEAFNKILSRKDYRGKPSKHPLVALKGKLMYGILWAAVITAGYLVLLFFIHDWIPVATLLLMIGFNTWVGYTTFSLLKQIPNAISPHKNLKQMLEQQYRSFLSWQKQQERVALFVYPFAAGGGFILGGTVGAGKPIEYLMHKTAIQIAFPVTILILVPACWYLAKWMFKVAYGKDIKQLKALIEELENG
jgi:hypothetical protein